MISSQGIELLDMSEATINKVTSTFIASSAFRLDASSFLNANTRMSLTTVESSGYLSDLADVFTVYIQTPILYYVERFNQSRPYLTTSELGEYQDHALTHVSIISDPRLIEWEIKQGNIVLSRSGRVGDAYWVDKKLDSALVGDSFRVVPKNPEDGYFLYALLSSSLAKDYMTGVSYGSVVDHASVAQARSLPVPCVKEKSRSRISELIKGALEDRDAAYDLLAEAEKALLRVNELPEISDSSPYRFDPLGNPDFTEVKATKVIGKNGNQLEYRLDAHFYNPLAQLAIMNIRNSKSDVKTIEEVTKKVFFLNRFSRTFVNEEHGIPYLAGGDIVRIRPSSKHYLSRTQTNDIDQYMLNKGWILLTCSGTIGRTTFVWENFESHAATHDLIRIISNQEEIDPGYLYAFLSSPYGKEQVLRYRHGSVIDHITPEQVEKVLIPLPPETKQKEIGDLVRAAYEKRAEAIRLEDEAQKILMDALTK